MKKILLLIIAAFLSMSVNAADAFFYANDKVEAKVGETITFNVAMKNVKNILAFQFWLTLPDGISVNQRTNVDAEQEFDIDLTNRKKSKHVLDLDVTITGALQVIGEPTDGRSIFKGNEGDLVTMKLKVSSDMKPGNYTIKISNIEFAPEDMIAGIEQADLEIPITIYQDYNITATSANETMGTVTGGGNYRNGTKATLTATPNEGYHFVKWSNDVTENPYTFAVDKDLALTATFDAKEYNLIYMVDGVEYKKVPVKFGSTITPEAFPTKVGYTFSGWGEIPATMPTSDVTVNGTFAINKYTFTFDTDGGSEVAGITQDYNSAITVPTAPTKTGYTFAGWVPAIPETVPAENMSFKAQWTINQYTLTFDADNGTEATVITQDFNTKFETPAAPTKTGYTFAGWDSEVPETIPAENKSFKALWTINQYTFTFDADGGSDVAAITQNYGTKIETPAAPTKTGYTFAGWVPAIPETVPAENMSFKAQWTINQYTLTFNADNGTEDVKITQNYGTKFESPATPTKTGYTFAGWDMDIPETIPAENMSFTAKWIANQYTLTFDSNGGSDVAAITQDYGTKIDTPAAPTKTGYTFAGWDNEIPETMPAESMNFKALWTINQYTLTFNADNGTEDVEITQDYGTKFDTPADPTREGYTFAGWDMDIPETIPAEDMRFTAKWIANQYTLTFDSDGGSDVAAITQDYGTKIETPAAPTKTGYTFAGWDNEIPETMPAESMSFKAQWTINQYTLTFNADNGTEDVEITQDYGTKFETPADPTREGYTFAGWDMDIPETIPAEDMSFTALWSVNSYKLVYILDGEVYAEYDVEYGSEITPENDPEKTGYTFDGWTGIPETMPAHDVEIYGSFSVVTAIRTILADEKAVDVYNLNGVLVKRNVEVDKLDKVLKKGVYIICGKKFVVK